MKQIANYDFWVVGFDDAAMVRLLKNHAESLDVALYGNIYSSLDDEADFGDLLNIFKGKRNYTKRGKPFRK